MLKKHPFLKMLIIDIGLDKQKNVSVKLLIFSYP